ncbi:uncharacterized protein LOC110365005 isoform X2 [Columba livia]|uniref:uncharacterized protein LOC110365005 isoform X2 n=1 Tax=Columba livia TaxID=8932 RepID=UPI0031BAA1E4
MAARGLPPACGTRARPSWSHSVTVSARERVPVLLQGLFATEPRALEEPLNGRGVGEEPGPPLPSAASPATPRFRRGFLLKRNRREESPSSPSAPRTPTGRPRMEERDRVRKVLPPCLRVVAGEGCSGCSVGDAEGGRGSRRSVNHGHQGDVGTAAVAQEGLLGEDPSGRKAPGPPGSGGSRRDEAGTPRDPPGTGSGRAAQPDSSSKELTEAFRHLGCN